MNREIVNIDVEKCNGCGLCIPNCHEGALQIIDNKAVLVSELMCDGLGACLGHCPEGALTIETREAEPYDELKVMQEMIKKGKNVVIAHLKHLKEHNEQGYLKQGIRFLWENKDILSFNPAVVVEEVNGIKQVQEFSVDKGTRDQAIHASHSCPGSKSLHFERENSVSVAEDSAGQISALTHWPVQLHLINPSAGHFVGCDLLLSADCVAFTLGNFHRKFLKNKKLVIACPKLDQGMEVYVEKIRILIEETRINTLTVMRMEVPCCGGLMQVVRVASRNSKVKVPVKELVVSIKGEILSEEWMTY